MSDQNPDQDWLARALQNMNQPPSPPAIRDENTTDHNPFRRSTRGTYGLRQTHGQERRTNTPPWAGGSERPFSLSSTYSGTNPWGVPSSTYTLPLNYPTNPQHETQYPRTRRQIPAPFPGRIQGHYDQRSVIASPSPRRPDNAAQLGRLAYQSRSPRYTGDGHRRILTPTPTPMSPDPLNPQGEPNPLDLPEESPFNPRGQDYEWNQLEQVDRDILGPYATEA
ncbi:hypothetical protein ARMGADRAFT_1026356 [Armillaria gallica]|uniref:Uncharacterized protein n=1 Tax=Armillaria gallica TaxID=47427 RepID=A0A2H3DWQ5_ARMGA|nr:hypothetical protein ARMGADRAFT_1026356 [Armillaria gallica]